MFDQLRSKNVATVSAVLALSLGITACGGQESNTEQSPQGSNQTGKSADGLSFSVYMAYCDGPDLIIQHGAESPNDIRTERRPDNPRCVTGNLAPRHARREAQHK